MPPEQRPSLQLPPTDHVARMLMRLGAHDAGLEVLHAAVHRDKGERACAALLRALELRPDVFVRGPDVVLDLGLVAGLARASMLCEARAVLSGASLDATAEGKAWQARLDELLAPPEPEAPEEQQEAVRRIALGGAAIALAALDDLPEKSLTPSSRRRRDRLRELLFADAEVAPARVSVNLALGDGPWRQAVSHRVRARDLAGASLLAELAASSDPSDVEAAALAASLGRLVDALEKSVFGPSDGDGVETSTRPIEGREFAIFQLSMGNVTEAERVLRRILAESPADDAARFWLKDCENARRILGFAAPTIPPGSVSRAGWEEATNVENDQGPVPVRGASGSGQAADAPRPLAGRAAGGPDPGLPYAVTVEAHRDIDTLSFGAEVTSERILAEPVPIGAFRTGQQQQMAKDRAKALLLGARQATAAMGLGGAQSVRNTHAAVERDGVRICPIVVVGE